MPKRVPLLGRLPRFTTVGKAEKINLSHAMRHKLSGYVAGNHRGGYWVERLKYEWGKAFHCKHVIPCNSATSGLLAACMAAGVGPGDEVWVPAYTMSATASCAKVLGAKVKYIDIEPKRLSLDHVFLPGHTPKVVIVTNLFGHPAYLMALRKMCDHLGIVMIEDNAQAPFAMEGGRYAGTVGHMGVFSFNVHKHLTCGEGGIVITNDAAIADGVSGAINHGESSDNGSVHGLNLRITETSAAIACAQLSKATGIIESRRELAHALTEMVEDIPFILPPIEDKDCKHVYYVWAARVVNGKRKELVDFLISRAFPIREGYIQPLQSMPMADKIESELMLFEVCAWSPRGKDLRAMKRIMHAAAESVE